MMNTIMRICIYICIILIFFNLGIVVINSLEDADGNKLFPGFKSEASYDANTIYAAVIAAVGVSAAASLFSKDIRPFAATAFGATFWVPLFSAMSIFGGIGVPGEMITMVEVGLAFVFAGGLIGVVTGSG